MKHMRQAIAGWLRPGRRAPLLAAGVVVLAALLFFGRLGARSLWTMEVRWAEIPREMQQRGDYFRPTINGVLYFDKPLGSYWLVLGAGKLTGRIDETTARLPSAICALLAVLLCMRLARQLGGGKTALWSGFILATSFSFVDFARTASADMENLAGILAALVLYFECRQRPTGWWLMPFWLIMTLTSLTKGLLGFALPLLVIGTFATLSAAGDPAEVDQAWFRRVVIGRNRWFFNWKTGLAIKLAVTVYLLPFALSNEAGPGLAMVFRENVQRFFAPVNHKGPIYLYAIALFALMAPWAALLPAALTYAVQRRTERNEGRLFALTYFCVTFAFFTLSASRRSYYVLPILPAGALLVADLLAAPPERMTRLAYSLLQGGFAALAVFAAAMGFALVPRDGWLPEPWSSLPDVPAAPLFAAVWVVILAGISYALFGPQPRRIAVAFATTAGLSMTFLFLFALPAAEQYRGEKTFAQQVRRTVGADTPGLALYRTREVVFYLDLQEHVNEFESDNALSAAVAEGRVRWLIVRERDLDHVPRPYIVANAAAAYPWEERSGKTRALLVRFQRGPKPRTERGG
jgi:4-amino-4-deoxy-L-arabinose transferase-like glycosyltransferase